MRELTEAEYRTLLAIFQDPLGTDRARMDASGLPSSTYNVVRRRAYEEGWLSDHLFPSIGMARASHWRLALARPRTSERQSLAVRWEQSPECWLLCSGLHGVLALFAGDGPTPSETSDAPPAAEPPFEVQVTASSGNVPVFFDFSGMWARFGDRPVPSGYPRGLPVSSRRVDPRSARAAESALQDPRPRSAYRAPRPWLNIGSFPRSQRRALDLGFVQLRTLLDLSRLPSFEGRRVGEVIFVTGRLRSSTSATRLLGDLTSRCHVFPFLLVESDRRLLLAGGAQTNARVIGRHPVPAARAPVLATLQEHLDETDVLVEPVDSLSLTAA